MSTVAAAAVSTVATAVSVVASVAAPPHAASAAIAKIAITFFIFWFFDSDRSYQCANLDQIKITNKNLNTLAGENLDYTIDVLLSNVNASYKNNVVDQLTFKLERV